MYSREYIFQILHAVFSVHSSEAPLWTEKCSKCCFTKQLVLIKIFKLHIKWYRIPINRYFTRCVIGTVHGTTLMWVPHYASFSLGKKVIIIHNIVINQKRTPFKLYIIWWWKIAMNGFHRSASIYFCDSTDSSGSDLLRKVVKIVRFYIQTNQSTKTENSSYPSDLYAFCHIGTA